MEEIRKFCFSGKVTGGIVFILLGLIVNYIFRDVFHSIPIDKIILGSDPEGYYQYLPHFFLRDWQHFEHLPWAIPYGEGKSISVFTCGVAILWSPFFVLAHFISVFFNLDADGYGNVYYGFVLIAALFYVYIGLVFLYKLITEEFGKMISLKTVALVFLGTNVFYYTLILGAGMSHAYSFALISAYIFYVHRYFQSPSYRNALFMAIPFALAVLIRPTNIISGFYFFFFGIKNMETLNLRFKFWTKNMKTIGIVALVGLVIAIPQMLYWYKVSGKPIVYSYGDYGFPYLASPKIGIVLFGKYNGWFLYTPLVLFAFWGLFATLRKGAYNNIAVLFIFVLAIYFNASWWAPTFSAACGQRAMIDFLPFLVLPLAWFIKQVSGQSNYLRVLFSVTIIVILFYNIQFAFRYNPVEWWDTPMSWEKFWHFLKF
ncbi:MAG: hypothetical protein RBS73_14090 [Prolixibacteraceae bacterium]|jgi:hypothetical protein|nr:hypothetical protein [Prolixibacteraceae bacterium]